MTTPPQAARLRALSPAPLRHEQVVPARGLIVGRDPGRAALLLVTATVSRRHCWIGHDPDSGWLICDLDSTNGVFVDGRRVDGQARLYPGMVIGLGNGATPDFEFIIDDNPRRSLVLPAGGRWLVGRSLQADISLPADPTVSHRHAEIIAVDGELRVADLDSLNGTRIDGRRIRHGRIEPNRPMAMGNSTLLIRSLEDGRLQATIDGRTPGLRMQVIGLRCDSPPLERLDLVVQPGTLVGITAEQPGQAAMLLEIIAGRRLPAGGAILYNDLPLTDVHARGDARIGLVRHREPETGTLTVEQHMRYTADIRLPSDFDRTRRNSLVATTLTALGLDVCAGMRMRDLEPAQRRLAAIAAELVTRPTLLCLDEPFADLDAHQAGRLLESLRRLARTGTSVIIANRNWNRQNRLDRHVRIDAAGRVTSDGGDARKSFSERARQLAAEPGIQLTRTAPQKAPAIGSLHRLVASYRRRCRIRLTRPLSLAVAVVSGSLLAMAAAYGFSSGQDATAMLTLAVAAAATFTALPEAVADRHWLRRELAGSLRPAEDLLARFGCGWTIAAAQAILIAAVFHWVSGGVAPTAGVALPGLVLVAASASALGLMIGTLEPTRGHAALLATVPAVFALQWLVLEFPAAQNALLAWLHFRLRDLLPGYWGAVLVDGPRPIAETLRASAFLAGQAITWLAIARALHARRYRLR